jgi:chemotaxis-related protein WspB
VATPALFLLVRLGEHLFAIDVEPIVEVISLVRLKVVPRAPAASAGVMSYRGEVVPVIDLNILALGVPTPARLMTRIVIVRLEAGDVGVVTLLGLLVPEVLRTAHLDPGAFASPSFAADSAGYLGGVVVTDDGVIQLVHLPALSSVAMGAITTLPAAV